MALTGPQIAANVTAAFSAYGNSLTMTRSSSPTTIRAIHLAPNRPEIQKYLDDNATVGLTYPALEVFMDATAGGTGYVPAVLDTCVVDGRTYSVQKVLTWRLAGAVILYSFLMD